MAKVLLITSVRAAAATGGRALLCKLNRSALTDIYGPDLVTLELLHRPLQSGLAAARAFAGHIDGIDTAILHAICAAISVHGIAQVFIDGSNLGEVARTVKSRFSQVEVVTFFHNVEARFFLGSLRHTHSLRALAIMIANFLAERKAVRHSDRLVCLSARDSELLGRLYGRKATDVSPIALEDQVASAETTPEFPQEKFALFVGGRFYANQAGITWYADHVAPRVGMKTYVVGHGLEAMRDRLERSGNVKVVGSVQSLAAWYASAHIAIAPIFDGSGMKTKVAEALMHGKRVIGTPEAFSGYEEIAPAAGDVCRNAEEFIAALHHACERPYVRSDPHLRSLYERKYSYEAARGRLREILLHGRPPTF